MLSTICGGAMVHGSTSRSGMVGLQFPPGNIPEGGGKAEDIDMAEACSAKAFSQLKSMGASAATSLDAVTTVAFTGLFCCNFRNQLPGLQHPTVCRAGSSDAICCYFRTA